MMGEIVLRRIRQRKLDILEFRHFQNVREKLRVNSTLPAPIMAILKVTAFSHAYQHFRRRPSRALAIASAK